MARPRSPRVLRHAKWRLAARSPPSAPCWYRAAPGPGPCRYRGPIHTTWRWRCLPINYAVPGLCDTTAWLPRHFYRFRCLVAIIGRNATALLRLLAAPPSGPPDGIGRQMGMLRQLKLACSEPLLAAALKAGSGGARRYRMGIHRSHRGQCPHSNTGSSLAASMMNVHDQVLSLCVNVGTDPGGQCS